MIIVQENNIIYKLAMPPPSPLCYVELFVKLLRLDRSDDRPEPARRLHDGLMSTAWTASCTAGAGVGPCGENQLWVGLSFPRSEGIRVQNRRRQHPLAIVVFLIIGGLGPPSVSALSEHQIVVNGV